MEYEKLFKHDNFYENLAKQFFDRLPVCAWFLFLSIRVPFYKKRIFGWKTTCLNLNKRFMKNVSEKLVICTITWLFVKWLNH